MVGSAFHKLGIYGDTEVAQEMPGTASWLYDQVMKSQDLGQVRMGILKTTLFVLFSSLLLSPSSSVANCEVGAYLIHTSAEYPQLDAERRWFFRWSAADDLLDLLPTVGHSDDAARAMLAFLRGPHRTLLRLERGGEICEPAAATAFDPDAVELLESDNMWGSLLVRFPTCLKPPADAPTTGYVLYDRDTKIAHIGEPLRIAPAVAAEPALVTALTERALGLGLHAEVGAAATLTSEDVASSRVEIIPVGAMGFRMLVVILRLQNLDHLLAESGYLASELLRDKGADFPVIFWQHGEGEPFYVGDGSWCSSYRLGVEIGNHNAAREDTIRDLGPMERFSLTAAYDVDGDGEPEILVVNEQVAYYLVDRKIPDHRGIDGKPKLWVVHYGQGC